MQSLGAPLLPAAAVDVPARGPGPTAGSARRHLSPGVRCAASPPSPSADPLSWLRATSGSATLGAREIAAELDDRYRLLAKGHLCSAEDALVRPHAASDMESLDGGEVVSPGLKVKEGRSSEVATVLVILKAFIGGTMLVLPDSLSQTGLVSGNVTLWMVGLLELWCMLKLVDAHERFGGSFGQLAERAMGTWGSTAVEASIVLSQLGFTAAEMIYVAKTGAFVFEWLSYRFPLVHAWFGYVEQTEIEPSLIWLQLLVAVPVSWYRELGALTFFNFVGNTLILSAVAVLSIVTVEGLAKHGHAGTVKLGCPVQQVLIFTGFSVYAFEGITMVIPIYTAHKNKETFGQILTWTIVGITMLFSVFASANVVLYGEYVKPILTLNLPSGSPLRVGVSCAFALGSLTLVFLMAFPTYEIMENYLRQTFGLNLRSPCAVNALRSLIICVCALTARFGGAQLDLFLSVVGAIGCVPLAFVYPAVIHLQLVATSRRQKLVDAFIILLGMSIMALCISQVL